MFKARLELNFGSLDLGADVLASVVNMLPERRDAAEWYEELAKYPFSRVKAAVACKTLLTDETVRLLALDKSQAVIIALLCKYRQCDIAQRGQRTGRRGVFLS